MKNEIGILIILFANYFTVSWDLQQNDVSCKQIAYALKRVYESLETCLKWLLILIITLHYIYTRKEIFKILHIII